MTTVMKVKKEPKAPPTVLMMGADSEIGIFRTVDLSKQTSCFPRERKRVQYAGLYLLRTHVVSTTKKNWHASARAVYFAKEKGQRCGSRIGVQVLDHSRKAPDTWNDVHIPERDFWLLHHRWLFIR